MVVEKLSFLESAILNFFFQKKILFFFAWNLFKLGIVYGIPRMERNFDDYPDFQKNQGGYRIMRHTVPMYIIKSWWSPSSWNWGQLRINVTLITDGLFWVKRKGFFCTKQVSKLFAHHKSVKIIVVHTEETVRWQILYRHISSGQRNLMKNYHNKANTGRITKIELNFILDFFKQTR